MSYTIEDCDWVYGGGVKEGAYAIELSLKYEELAERFTDNIYEYRNIEEALSSGFFYEWADGEKVLPAEYLK